MQMQVNNPSLRFPVAVLSIVAAAFLCYDLWLVATGSINPNEYIPFVYPTVLGFFIWVAVKIERLAKNRPPEDLARIKYKDGSFD